MQYSLLEVVQLQQDFPNLSLFRGSTGTIVDTYMDPQEAYEVEFCDDRGVTIALLTLRPEQLRIISNL